MAAIWLGSQHENNAKNSVNSQRKYDHNSGSPFHGYFPISSTYPKVKGTLHVPSKPLKGYKRFTAYVRRREVNVKRSRRQQYLPPQSCSFSFKMRSIGALHQLTRSYKLDNIAQAKNKALLLVLRMCQTSSLELMPMHSRKSHVSLRGTAPSHFSRCLVSSMLLR